MRIIFLTQYYPPEHGAPQNRLHDLARRWAGAGHDVTVLTAMPNYPNGVVADGYRGKFFRRGEIDGVKVLRSWIYATRRKSTIRQLACYFSFVFSSICVGMFRLPKADFLICESPPLFLGFSALILKWATRSKLVMNISDLWPESAVQLGMIGPGPSLSFLEWFEGLLYRRAAVVSCQTEGIAEGVVKRCPAAHAVLLPNGVDLDMFPMSAKNAGLACGLGFPEDSFIVGYGGNHGRSQALRQVLAAAGIIQEKAADGNIHFALFGDGPEKDELMAEAGGLSNISFHPSQERSRMAEVQGQWDIALVPLKNIDLFDGARPSKMFELMAGGVPFIFCGRGEGAEIALESGCAVVVEPENPAQLADKIIELSEAGTEFLRNMGRSGRGFVSEKYDRAVIAEKFMGELEHVFET